MQRDKGKRGELDCAAIYVARGIDVRRLGNAAGLADLTRLADFGVHAEVKSQGTSDVPGWMRQTIAEAGPNIPALHWRLCRRGLTTPFYVNLLLDDFIDLLKEAKS